MIKTYINYLMLALTVACAVTWAGDTRIPADTSDLVAEARKLANLMMLCKFNDHEVVSGMAARVEELVPQVADQRAQLIAVQQKSEGLADRLKALQEEHFYLTARREAILREYGILSDSIVEAEAASSSSLISSPSSSSSSGSNVLAECVSLPVMPGALPVARKNGDLAFLLRANQATLSESRLRVRYRSVSPVDDPATDSPKRLRSRRGAVDVSAQVFAPAIYTCECGKPADTLRGLRIHQARMKCSGEEESIVEEANNAELESIPSDDEIAPALSGEEEQ